jgi:hypothetical protein
LTLKATSFSQLYEQLYKTIQYPRKWYKNNRLMKSR